MANIFNEQTQIFTTKFNFYGNIINFIKVFFVFIGSFFQLLGKTELLFRVFDYFPIVSNNNSF